MNAPPRESLRRGWCPSTLRPMETGDGWLVRLHPQGGRLRPAQLCRIAALARESGNGLIEISGRGNLQLRGIRHEAHPALVEALLTEELVDEREDDGPAKLCLTSPLAGHDPSDHLDAAALAEGIEAGARAIKGLPAKISVAIDGGGALSLDGFAADMRLRAIGSGDVLIGLPHGLWLGPVTPDHAVATVAAMLTRFARLHAEAPGTVLRLRDIPADALAIATGLQRAEAPPSRLAPRRAGAFPLRNGSSAVLVALPFGRSDAATLDQLGQLAAEEGAHAVRFSPWRGVAILGLSASAATTLLREAAALGLITGDRDPRLGVTACSGKPACLRGETETMADAALLAKAVAPLLAEGATLHVSGCIKSCAHPGKADLTLVGDAGGYRLAIAGATCDATGERLDLSRILPRLQPGQDLHQRVAEAQLSGRRH